MLDILSTLPETNVFEVIREEASQLFTSEADWTDPAALQKLRLPASAIRESLRRSLIQVRGLMREVIPEKGLVLPDGNHIAKGTWIGVLAQAVSAIFGLILRILWEHFVSASPCTYLLLLRINFSRYLTDSPSGRSTWTSASTPTHTHTTPPTLLESKRPRVQVRKKFDATQPTDTFLGSSYGRHAW